MNTIFQEWVGKFVKIFVTKRKIEPIMLKSATNNSRIENFSGATKCYTSRWLNRYECINIFKTPMGFVVCFFFFLTHHCSSLTKDKLSKVSSFI